MAILLVLLARHSGTERAGAVAGRMPWRDTPPRAAYPRARSVYPHSVIPGGAFSPAELEAAMRSDPVVAVHYAGFDAAHLRTEAADAGRKVYVSYRRADRIYWTKKAIPLQPGEVLLSDGASQARARCGNRISDTPRQPTAIGEPADEEFDTPEDEKTSSSALSGERERSQEGGARPGIGAGDGAGGGLAGIPFWLAPDLFAPPNPVSGMDFGDGDKEQEGFLPPSRSSPGFLSGGITVRGAPAVERLAPLGPLPAEPKTAVPVVVLALSVLPETGSGSATWKDPGVASPNQGLLFRPVPSADPGEVVFRVSSPVPVPPWWWSTPNLPPNPAVPGPLKPSGGPPGSGPPSSPLEPLGSNGNLLTPDPAQSVPEPQTGALVAVALYYLWLRGRRSTRRSRP